MVRSWIAAGALAALGLFSISIPALAQTQRHTKVLDAVYRGTLTCSKLPMTDYAVREAIAVTISNSGSSYTHVVRFRDKPEPVEEKGTVKLDSDKVSLEGSWSGDAGRYQASYNGTVVRRSAKLFGTQTWTIDGRIVTRRCAGTIKRPLRAFLPRGGKPVSQ